MSRPLESRMGRRSCQRSALLRPLRFGERGKSSRCRIRPLRLGEQGKGTCCGSRPCRAIGAEGGWRGRRWGSWAWRAAGRGGQLGEGGWLAMKPASRSARRAAGTEGDGGGWPIGAIGTEGDRGGRRVDGPSARKVIGVDGERRSSCCLPLYLNN